MKLRSQEFVLICLIFLALLLRFITLGLYDLFDTTEARYAAIALRMATNGDWITPYISPNVPFPLLFSLFSRIFEVH